MKHKLRHGSPWCYSCNRCVWVIEGWMSQGAILSFTRAYFSVFQDRHAGIGLLWHLLYHLLQASYSLYAVSKHN